MAPRSRKNFMRLPRRSCKETEWRMWAAYAWGLSGPARDAFPCLVFYPRRDKTEGLDAGTGCQHLNFRKAGMGKRKLSGLKRLQQGV